MTLSVPPPYASTQDSSHRRCGFCAVIGAPNVGKSTLINRAVGTRVSIVSPKVQTTRTRVLGIMMHKDCQLIFTDTPGIFTPKRRLDRAMVSAAWNGAMESDMILLLIDARRGVDDDTLAIIKQLNHHDAQATRPVWLVLNKVDVVKKPDLLDLTRHLHALGTFPQTYMISALDGTGVDDLTGAIADTLPKGPWLFPPEQISDMPERMLAAEITREQLYLKLHQELPYEATVETERYTEKKDGSIAIHQIIIVTKESHRAIVLGKGGARIKAISSAARHELQGIMDCTVHLMLFVRVRADWSEKQGYYASWGLDYGA